MPERYRSDTLEQRISIERLEQAVNIFGSFDENIRLLEQEFSVTVVNREGELRVEGEAENTMLACKAIQALLTLSSRPDANGWFSILADRYSGYLLRCRRNNHEHS